jgi:hypothetical protein
MQRKALPTPIRSATYAWVRPRRRRISANRQPRLGQHLLLARLEFLPADPLDQLLGPRDRQPVPLPPVAAPVPCDQQDR